MRFSIPATLALQQLILGKATSRAVAFSIASNPVLPSSYRNKIQIHRHLSLAVAADGFENDSALYTSADITETIRHESQMEMTKVEKLLSSLSSSPSSKAPILLQTKDQVTSYLSKTHNIQNYLFDCDGVLYRGTDPMPDVSQTIQSLINNGKRVFFVTNNAGSSRFELKCKLEKVLQCPEGMLTEEMMIGSAYVAARYLQSRLSNNYGEDNATIQSKSAPRVHVIGTAGLCHEIQSAGFNVSGGPDPERTPSGMSRDELASYSFPEVNGKLLEGGGIDAVVVGLDNDWNYRKLCIATVLLQHNPQALLVATNLDSFDLVGHDARHLPGNGALVASVEAASGRTAINVGKPSDVLSQLIMETFKLKAEETIMIGDRLDTDVKFGNDGGMKSGLVLTGCATTADIEEVMHLEDDVSMIPSVIFPHVGLMGS